MPHQFGITTAGFCLFIASFFTWATGTTSPTTVTLLFTNDFESAYDPTPAYWRSDMSHIGGIAQLASLIEDIRKKEPKVFLFDSGDIFTGTLAKLTAGEISFELMNSMAYDAMAIGNHEFEYGWEVFSRQKHRVPFPVLSANLYYKGTDILYAQPYSIIERNGVRIGVLGIMGQDAGTALNPANIAGLEVRDPKVIVPEYVKLLRPDVDLIVLLAHQGKTAPMQTNDESPEVKRDIDADIELAGIIQGIDILLGGHADAGTEKPVVHPQTGTLIMQTYGQGFYLGYLQLKIDVTKNKILSHEGKLIPVNADKLPAHPQIAQKLADYRSRFPQLQEVVGHTEKRINRRYNQESDLGNLFADILRWKTGAEIGFMPSGALRKDLPSGKVSLVSLLDVFPFQDRVYTLSMTGKQILAVLEQSLSLERGIMQVSGLKVHYDLSRPTGKRVNKVTVADKTLLMQQRYTVSTVEIMAKGGDLYQTFREATVINKQWPSFDEILLDYFASKNMVAAPERGRLFAKK